MSSARAETALPASATVVRNAVLALSLADAALPFATAVKYAPSDAPIRIASSRRDTTVSSVSFYDRRIRAYRDSFPLFLGVGY